MTDATAAVEGLRGVRYSWVKEAPGADGQQERFLGFLAQEVEDVLPELVSTDAEGTKSVNYVGVVPVLVEALKEERAARTALEARLDAVERERLARETPSSSEREHAMFSPPAARPRPRDACPPRRRPLP